MQELGATYDPKTKTLRWDLETQVDAKAFAKGLRIVVRFPEDWTRDLARKALDAAARWFEIWASDGVVNLDFLESELPAAIARAGIPKWVAGRRQAKVDFRADGSPVSPMMTLWVHIPAELPATDG